MAEQRTIELEIKLEKAQKSLDAMKEELLDVNDNLEEIGKSGSKSFKKLGDTVEKSTKSTNKIMKGLTGVGNLFKASGVFFIVTKVLEGLQSAFMENQRVIDLFAIAGRMATKVITDFTNFIFDNFDGVTDSFTSVFEDPVGSIKKLAKAIKDNLLERINSALKMFGLLGSAVKKLFARDFDGAMEDAKMAGKEFTDVMTGVDGSFDKVTKPLVKYTKELYTSSKALVEQEKNVEKLAAKNQGLIEQYDVQAESLRQVRDSEANSIDARIEANDKLRQVLLEQKKVMLENQKQIVETARLRFQTTGKDEDEVLLQQARNELKAIEARVTGQLSEALVNENTLRKEKLDLMNELNLIGKDENERAMLEAQQLREQQLATIEREVSDEELKAQLKENVLKEYQNTVAEIDQQIADDKEAKRVEEIDREQQVTQARIGFAKGALGALQNLAKEGSAGAKALAVGQTILDAYSAISATFANASKNPSTILFPGYPFVQAGIAAVNAFATVKKIMAVNPEQPSGATASSTPRQSNVAQPPTQSQAPAFNIVGASPVNQLAESINNREQKPIKAFVVSNDVTNAQALDRNIVEQASIG